MVFTPPAASTDRNETDIASTAIRVDVNGPVECRIDKDHLYIKRPDGKARKLDLVKTTRKE